VAARARVCCWLLILVAVGAAARAPSDPRAALQSRLTALVRSSGWRSAQVGVQVQSLATGEILFGYNPDIPLKAASLTKLATALAALKAWGPTHAFPTEIYCRPPDAAGTVRGDLTVKAYGDPTLVQEQLWLLVRELRQRGLRRIEGDLVFDGSHLDPALFPAGWRNVPNPKTYYAPLSPFALNYNIVAVKITPGPASGAAAVVATDPQSGHLLITNRARTGAAGSRASIAAYSRSSAEGLRITVTGTIPSTRHEAEVRYFAIDDPARNYQAAVLQQLTDLGIQLDGAPRPGVAPPGPPYYRFQGRSLAWTLRLMNKFSNNFIADQLVRLLGADRIGPPGTTEKGIAIIRQILLDCGLDPLGFQLQDGSGLTYENRFSAAQMVRLLHYAYFDFRLRAEFTSSMGINGYEGSIDDRMLGSQILGLVRAKTGHLNDVTNIAGYVASRDGEVMAFAILANDYPSGVTTIHRLQDQMITALAEFSR
jgi:D-alanyl-D-alanine carboxypeptidase/D-alanyl-D-alanine-endopeptidase (penicillin-binding protein 4)